MKNLQQQIANKCVHFNGIMNNACKIGVKYADVRIDKPYKFPCLNQCDTCDKRQFLTPEQVEHELAEIEAMTNEALFVVNRIKRHYEKTKERSGKLTCGCGGELHFAIALNEHIRAKCTQCNISVME